jgi:diguanylate cyclase (GGDEF)-like protein/PAS domain S-box-containing protein
MAERAMAVLDSIGDAVLSTDLTGNVIYLNRVAEHMTGWSAAEAYGRPLHEVLQVIDAESRDPVRDPLTMAMRRNAIVGLGENCVLIGRDGSESAIEDTAAPVHDRNGQVTGAVMVFRDVGAARALSLRMSHLAQHDVLTGLPNRLLLTDRLDRAIAAARRHGVSLAVLFLDLDGFKHINDSLGHSTGDRVLQAVARRLEAGVRRSDTVSRHGGDEFVVLLSEVACAKDATLNADKLLAAIAVPHHIDNQALQVTASLGISLYPADGTDPETLLQQADIALLRAKARRNSSRPQHEGPVACVQVGASRQVS